MKMHLKKASLVVIATLLVFSLALGCSSEGSTKGGSTETPKSTSDVQESQKPGEEEPMKLRLLGRSNPGSSAKYVKFEDREKYPVWHELQKMIDAYNLDLEYEIVPTEQYQVVIQTRMAASSNLPDIANITPLDNETALNLAKQGVILELKSLIDEHSNGNIMRMYSEVYPFAPKLTTAPDGNMYWFSNLHIKTYKVTELAPVGLTMLVRKDWMEKLELDTPTNADEYYDMLKHMQENDANGNNQKDEVLVYEPSGFGGAIAQWFGLGTGLTSIDFESGKVISPWYQEGIKEYFQYMNKLVEGGILDTTLIGAQGDRVNQAVMENKVASIHNYGTQTWYEPMVTAEEAEYLPLMPLQAVDGITPASQVEPPHLVWEKYAITKGCENPKAAIAFFDMVHTDEYSTLSTWGIEGVNFTVENGINMITEKLTAEEQAETRRVAGNQIWGKTVFPVIQMQNEESELANVPDFKAEYQIDIMSYKPYFSNFNDNFLAIPNDEQLSEKTRIFNTLNTYSEELATKLVLGQLPLSDWDKYMQELEELGLDDLIQIEQELHDRFNSIE